MSGPSTTTARTERIIGAVLVTIGLVFAYFLVLAPFRAMANGAESVDFNFKSAYEYIYNYFVIIGGTTRFTSPAATIIQ